MKFSDFSDIVPRGWESADYVSSETTIKQSDKPFHGYLTYLKFWMESNADHLCNALTCEFDDLVAVRLSSREGEWNNYCTKIDTDLGIDFDKVLPLHGNHVLDYKVDSKSSCNREGLYIARLTDEIVNSNSAVLIRLPDSEMNVVYLRLMSSSSLANDVHESKHFIITCKDHFSAALEFIRETTLKLINLQRQDPNFIPRLVDAYRTRETTLPRRCEWSELTSAVAATELRNDIETFYNSRDWYDRNRLDWRRGYLFYGPPGNGKSTSIKVIASQLRMNIHTIDFSDKEIGDAELTETYRDAARNTPAIVALEDIDRTFGRGRDASKSNVSFQHLLNCIDGVGTPEGIITIATANNPEELDSAILKRPGRFHKLIAFNNPDDSERVNYFMGVEPEFSDDDLATIGRLSRGLSFAQLAEVRTQSMLGAFYQKRDRATAQEYLDSIHSIKSAYTSLKDKRSDKAGFNIN